MTFLSGLAALLAILLMVFGVNLSGLDGAPTPTSQPTASIGPESSMMAGETTPVPQATYEAPAPTGAAVVTDSWLDEDAARADAQSLLTALYGGMMGESYTAPAFVVDNMDTHLAARWGRLYARAHGAERRGAAGFVQPAGRGADAQRYAGGLRARRPSSCALRRYVNSRSTPPRAASTASS